MMMLLIQAPRKVVSRVEKSSLFINFLCSNLAQICYKIKSYQIPLENYVNFHLIFTILSWAFAKRDSIISQAFIAQNVLKSARSFLSQNIWLQVTSEGLRVFLEKQIMSYALFRLREMT